jgi:protein involved in polysaccharide export with SLBB domain
VQIVRRDGAARRTQVVDVAAVLRDGDTSGLPALLPGDQVTVPQSVVGSTSGPGDAVGVLGEVARPGLYPVGGGADLWMVLAGAGGVTPNGSLGGVRILTRGPSGIEVVNVNLSDVLAHGTKTPVTVRAGDVVYVGQRGGVAVGRAFAGMYQLLIIGRDVLNAAVLADYLKNSGK